MINHKSFVGGVLVVLFIGAATAVIETVGRRLSRPAAVAAVAYDPPVVTLEGRPTYGPKLDPANITQDNPGYYADFDGDGVTDYAIFSGNTFYYHRGPYTKGDALTPILVIKAELIAYSVQPLPGKTRPSLLFWDAARNGYYQENLGSREGIPYFGDLERQK